MLIVCFLCLSVPLGSGERQHRTSALAEFRRRFHGIRRPASSCLNRRMSGILEKRLGDCQLAVGGFSRIRDKKRAARRLHPAWTRVASDVSWTAPASRASARQTVSHVAALILILPAGRRSDRGGRSTLPAICCEVVVRPKPRQCQVNRRHRICCRFPADRGQARSYRFLIVPTLCVGTPARTLRVPVDAERRSLRYHAERGNDQNPSSAKRALAFDLRVFSSNPPKAEPVWR